MIFMVYSLFIGKCWCGCIHEFISINEAIEFFAKNHDGINIPRKTITYSNPKHKHIDKIRIGNMIFMIIRR